MKKKYLLFGTLCSLGLIASLTSCETTTAKVALSAKQKESVKTLTTMTLLDSVATPNPSLRMAQIFKASEGEATENQDGNATTLNDNTLKVLPTIDALFNSGVNINSTIEEGTFILKDKTYSFKEEIVYKLTKEQEKTYTLLYNKEAKVEDNTNKEPNKEETNKEPTIEETLNEFANSMNSEEKISGEVILGKYNLETELTAYPFTSIKESESNEQESETEKELKILLGENSYIVSKEEKEIEGNENEVEFSYLFVENGETKMDYSISIENEVDELTKVEYEVNGIEYEATLIKEGEDTFINLEVEKDDLETEGKYKRIVDENGNVTFEEVALK